MKDILALCKQQKIEEGFQWFYDGKLVIELVDECFYFYSEPFKMRALRFCRNNHLMLRQKFDDKKVEHYQMAPASYQRFIKLNG